MRYNEGFASYQVWRRYSDVMNVQLSTAMFFECLLDVYNIDAVLLMFGMDEWESGHSSTSADKERSVGSSSKRESTDNESYLRSKRDRVLELTLIKEFNSAVVERLLSTWISGIRFLDACCSPLDDKAKSPVMEICIRLCECLSRIFSKLNRLGGESFNVIITNSGLQQDIAAVLLRYFCGNIHSRLIRSVDEEFKAVLGVFFDLGE